MRMKNYINNMNILIVVTLCLKSITCFNLETSIPVVKIGTKGSFFGYSVAEHEIVYGNKSKESWILVGAPLEERNTNKTGAVWKCPLTTSLTDCQQIITHDTHINNLQPTQNIQQDKQWLGVSVRSQGSGGKVVVCAHRHIFKAGDLQFGQGFCYTLKNDLKFDREWEICRHRSTKREHEEYGYCQIGTSSGVLSDGTMILGSPGVFSWRGTIFVTNINDDIMDRMVYYGPHINGFSPVEKYSYLGMSVSGGKLFNDKMSYISGAPRGNYSGQVVVFSKNAISPFVNPIDVSMVLQGEQYASNFGYEVVTGDFNGDGFVDLVISAPFYFDGKIGGAVYLYINKNYKFESIYDLKLTGRSESRFGFSMVNLGDLNKDGCHDLAVGSPNEGNGVVYIYFGNRISGLDKKARQRIKAEDIPVTLSTFGYSLSGGMDLDNNGYPDLLVGDYSQSTVVLLRGRPIIDVDVFVSTDDSDKLVTINPFKVGCKNDPQASVACFALNICLKINSALDMQTLEALTLNYTIHAETFVRRRIVSRVYFDGNTQKFHIINKMIKLDMSMERLCEQHTVYIKDTTRDMQSPLKFRVKYSITEPDTHWSPMGPLISMENSPILNETKSILDFEIPMEKECGDDEVCESNILITSATLNLPAVDNTKNKYKLILGEQKTIKVYIYLDNLGEPAYNSLIFVSHHLGLTYVSAKITEMCIKCNATNNTLVSCTLKNPFKHSSNLEIQSVQLEFEPEQFEEKERILNLTIWTNSSSKEMEPNREPTVLQVHVSKVAEIIMSGGSKPDELSYINNSNSKLSADYIEDIGPKVIHTYQISNLGPSHTTALKIVVDWPSQIIDATNGEKKWLLYLDTKPLIEAENGGECFTSEENINMLNLPTRQRSMKAMELQVTSDNTDKFHIKHSQRNKLMRFKRDESSDMINILNEFDCYVNTMICVKVTCVIYKLARNQVAFVRISSRLMNNSMTDLANVKDINIKSQATLDLTNQIVVVTGVKTSKVSTNVYFYEDLSIDIEVASISLLVIIVSSIVGLVLCLICAFCLWKFGFFKRKDFEYSAIKKNNEEYSKYN